MKLLLTCEHGGNKVPATYRPLFAGSAALLTGHRGWDPGALSLFHELEPLTDASFSSTTTRLLVELNRSLHHPALFSAITKDLPKVERERILKLHYHPHRGAIDAQVAGWRAKAEHVMHLAVHSFTPVLHGEVRTLDVGFLYDPSRSVEKRWAERWRHELLALDPELEVRMNRPYLGKADGLPTHLRRLHRSGYAGIELEVNQGHLVRGRFPKGLCSILRTSLERSLAGA
jgi:predicted N-formylglutamate amidohydrolase